MRTIVVVNLKGGCGKSTIATHMAAAMARSAARAALADMDRQGSALRWLERRPPDAYPIGAIDWRKSMEKPPKGVDRLIIDGPAGLRGKALEETIALADVLVVPLLPSIFDEQATVRFLDRIDRIKAVRKGRTPTLLVANRYRKGGRAAERLEEFVTEAGRALTARISERAAYADLAVRGLTLFDLKTRAAANLMEEWMPLIEAADQA